MQCEKCGSARVQRAPYVYRTGRQRSRHGMPDILGLASATGPLQSPAGTAAQLAAPPKMRSLRYPLIGFLAVGAMLALSTQLGWVSTALGGVTLVGTLAGLAANSVYNRTTYPAAYRRWEQSCLCLNCGRLFERRY